MTIQRIPMAPAHNAKNSSGSIFIIGSVTGSKIHLSLLKNILWNTVKKNLKLVLITIDVISGVIIDIIEIYFI